MDDNISRENYILLGEIKKSQELQLKMMEELRKEVAWMKTKINIAVGITMAVVFFFQAAWAYLSRMGKA